MAKNENEYAFLQGNESCVRGALLAGVSFFAGYPITPSTEIAEEMARLLPVAGGRFIQMEDEIGSVGALCGASAAGAKSMTATSGPGFSLMQENIGYAYFTEIPIVIVNVQRGGASTGLPTKVSQSDTMQARWGTHGDFNAIAVAPDSVNDTLHQTIRAVNLAERYRTPVTVLLDEVIGHTREKIRIPRQEEIELVSRKLPTVSREEFIPYEDTEDGINPFPVYGMGYRSHMTGLTHNQYGFPTSDPEEIKKALDKLKYKFDRNAKDMIKVEAFMLDDAIIAIIAYGVVARAAKEAVIMARAKGLKLGLLNFKTVWPFPNDHVTELLSHVDDVIVAELNQGQLIHEVNRLNKKGKRIHPLNKYDSEILSPYQILEKVEAFQ